MQNDALNKATEWFVTLSSGTATAADYQAFAAWQQADEQHRNAWQQIEQVTTNFKTIASHQEINQTLQRMYSAPLRQRRQALKQLCLLAGTGVLAYSGYRTQPWQPLLADYSTATGSQQQIALADGTQLVLNTASSVNIAYTSSQRVVELIKGEVLIETAHETGRAYRPFVVKTQHGSVQALGTRFVVRDYGDFSQASVFEGAVKITSPQLAETSITLQAGESMRFSAAKMQPKTAADFSSMAWVKGFMVVDNMALGDFISELARYRAGYLQCDTNIAHIKISGSFPISNTDKTLQLISEKFAVKIHTYTRFLTKLSA